MDAKTRVVSTGLWLGLLQTALGYALLAESGSSILLYFAALIVWIAGGAVGAALPMTNSRPLLLAAGIAAIAAAGALAAHPFTPEAAGAALTAGFLAGVFAGRFLALRSLDFGDARRVLFLENNGFVVGLALGLVFLFVDPLALAISTALLWSALLADRSSSLRA